MKDSIDDQIHQVLIKTFRHAKAGYCWIAAKFGNDWQANLLLRRSILLCVRSKSEQTRCPVHSRMHDPIIKKKS